MLKILLLTLLVQVSTYVLMAKKWVESVLLLLPEYVFTQAFKLLLNYTVLILLPPLLRVQVAPLTADSPSAPAEGWPWFSRLCPAGEQQGETLAHRIRSAKVYWLWSESFQATKLEVKRKPKLCLMLKSQKPSFSFLRWHPRIYKKKRIGLNWKPLQLIRTTANSWSFNEHMNNSRYSLPFSRSHIRFAALKRKGAAVQF